MRLVAAGTVVAIVAFANSVAGLPPPPGAADVASATAAGAEAAIGRTPAAPAPKLADRMVEPMLEVAAESLARLACTGDADTSGGGGSGGADGASPRKGAAEHCSEATATAIREDMVRDGAHDTMLHVCRLSRRPPALKAATRALAAMAAPRVNRSALNDASAVGVLSRLVGAHAPVDRLGG